MDRRSHCIRVSDRVFPASQNRHRGGELRPKPSARFQLRFRQGTRRLPYTVTATRADEKMQSVRHSALIALAKARVWESEGWRVSIEGPDGREHAVAQLDAITAFKPEKLRSLVAMLPADEPAANGAHEGRLEPEDLQGPWIAYGPWPSVSPGAHAEKPQLLVSS